MERVTNGFKKRKTVGKMDFRKRWSSIFLHKNWIVVNTVRIGIHIANL
jgi:hypothetical protein